MHHKTSYFIPFAIYLMLVPFFSGLDLSIAEHFFKKGQGQFLNHFYLDLVYRYGLLPGQILGFTAACLFVVSFLLPSLKRWRHCFLFFVTCLILGPGLLVNATLKDHWGRPRPKQVIEFGGSQPFRPFFSPNFKHQPEPSKSFPSGHASMGFYFFTLALLGKRMNSRLLTLLGLISGSSFGTILSFTRVAQGGHFLSDVLTAGIVVWAVALFLDWLIFEKWQGIHEGLN